MYYHGQYASDEVMKNYVEFICSNVQLQAGACVNGKSGFPMKGCYIPVKLEIIEKLSRSAIFKMEALGHSKTFPLYMSRHKDPNSLLLELQRKIDDLTLEIAVENNIDQDELLKTYHPLRNFVRPK